MSSAAAATSTELVLDRYRPLRPLGSGGSGSVWLARDEETGMEIALKIVPREGKAGSRAEREAEAAARLRHERCLRAYGFGSDAGHVYIAYEYVRGRTLRDAMRSGSLRDRDTVEAAAQILDGLAHAHARGIVHRDVKPANVLLADGPQLNVRICDFGLAQFEDADTLTAVGDVPGTLAYIAPERLHGEEATPASDVWGVGVLLWEGLAGAHPFWGSPLHELPAAIGAGAPPLTELRPDLPKRLLAAVERALDPLAAKRPSAASLAEELRSSLRRRPEQGKRGQAPSARAVKPSVAAVGGRALPALTAGIAAAAGAAVLPFWPPALAVAFALAAAVAGLLSPRAGLAVALFVPLFPLGNLGLGPALLYGGAALGWLALCWRDARAGLAFAAGPLLAPLSLLALAPLAAQTARGAHRRAAHAGAAVLVAALWAGLRGAELPLLGVPAPADLGLAGSESPGPTAHALWSVLAAQPGLLVAAGALAAAAAALPLARSRGPWGIALLGAGLIACVLLAAPAVAGLPVVLGTWALCACLAWRAGR
ncbi:MAG: serine/threonine protein kinase [Actinobacteria bacterium]|nr:serine/threonine protein kinase [Actinomycetota bacterium]